MISPNIAQSALVELFGNEAPAVVDISDNFASEIRNHIKNKLTGNHTEPEKKTAMKIILKYLRQL